MTLDVAQDVAELKEELIYLRRDLHRHPELAFQERRTAEVVARRLTSLGYSVRTGVAETGVVGLLDSGRPGPTVMVRADMDALPIQEPRDRPYSSVHDGVMHACGHDAHTAIGLSVAAVLAKHRQRLRGKVKVVFQPAEEIIAGAQRMLDGGVMEDPPVDRVLGLHMWSPMEVGKVGVRAGAVWASVDEVRLVVRGKGGHGGLPHLSVDPVAIGAHLVTALQTLVSREVAPQQPAVVGFGVFQAGTQFNIVPDTAELRGNIRTLDNSVRRELLRRLPELAEGLVRAMRGELEYEHVRGSGCVVNDPDTAEAVRRAAEAAAAAQHVVDVEQGMVGDDVAIFLERAPGCYFLVGCANPARNIGAPHHSAHFDIDEGALSVGAEVLARAALHYLG